MTVIDVGPLHKRCHDTIAVRDISFAVERGEIFGILGPNGAGKTTTVECIAGLRTAGGGTVTVLDRASHDPELRRLVGVQLLESQLPEKMTAGEALWLYAAFYPEPADWRRLAAELGLTGKLGTRYGTRLELPADVFPRPVDAAGGVPRLLQRIADLTPLGAGERAVQAAMTGQWPSWESLTLLVAYTLVFGLAATRPRKGTSSPK